jgi:clan AA aspartic protease (TIGR02281 family)
MTDLYSFHHHNKYSSIKKRENPTMMMMSRLLILLFTSSICFASCSTRSVIESNSNKMEEATDFFNRLIQTSDNPIIVNMARINLKALQNSTPLAQTPCPPSNDFESQESRGKSAKTFTEVKLVRQVDNTYVVSAMVNNRYPATFLVDTGASHTVITPAMARQLGLPFDKGNTKVPVNTASGILNAPLVQLKRLSLGNLQVENVEAVVADLGENNPISGLLGMSFFHGMELSFKANKLIISR